MGELTPCPVQSAGRCQWAWSSQTWSRWCVGDGTDWSLRTTGSLWPAEAWWCSPWTAGCSRDAFSLVETHTGWWNYRTADDVYSFLKEDTSIICQFEVRYKRWKVHGFSWFMSRQQKLPEDSHFILEGLKLLWRGSSDVQHLHCHITWEERKGFLGSLGTMSGFTTVKAATHRILVHARQDGTVGRALVTVNLNVTQIPESWWPTDYRLGVRIPHLAEYKKITPLFTVLYWEALLSLSTNVTKLINLE